MDVDTTWPGGHEHARPLQHPQYQRGYRTRADWLEVRRARRYLLLASSGDIPAQWDSRALKLVGPIKDQSSCGSCWDFAGTGLVEIAGRLAGALPADAAGALSEQYVLDCVRSGGCSGDDHSTVLEEAQANGLPRESEYPRYEARPRSCRATASMSRLKIASWGYVAAAPQLDAVAPAEAIQRAIMAGGAVSVAVAAGSTWDGYSGGEHWSDLRGINHEVILIGWRPSQQRPGRVCWLLRNSWGLAWGERGHMWIGEGADQVGAEAVWALVSPPSPPPPPPPPPPPAGGWAWTDAAGRTLTVSLGAAAACGGVVT